MHGFLGGAKLGDVHTVDRKLKGCCQLTEHVRLCELLGMQTLATCPNLLVGVETASCQELGWIWGHTNPFTEDKDEPPRETRDQPEGHNEIMVLKGSM